MSRSALEKGLGPHPRKALEPGLRVRTVLLGEDAVPARFPVPRKHVDLAKDVAGVLRILGDWRKKMDAKIADSKSDLFGYGVLLGLLQRG